MRNCAARNHFRATLYLLYLATTECARGGALRSPFPVGDTRQLRSRLDARVSLMRNGGGETTLLLLEELRRAAGLPETTHHRTVIRRIENSVM